LHIVRAGTGACPYGILPDTLDRIFQTFKSFCTFHKYLGYITTRGNIPKFWIFWEPYGRMGQPNSLIPKGGSRMDPLIQSFATTLCTYALDKGAELVKDVGPKALDPSS